MVAVLLPGTSYTLHSSYAPARAFVDAGVTIALASDFNPGTCYCENLQTIVSLACQEMRLTPAEALRAATLGGAHALGLQARSAVSRWASAATSSSLRRRRHRELPYHFGVNLVDAVVVDGGLVVSGGTLVAAEPSARCVGHAGAAQGGGVTS